MVSVGAIIPQISVREYIGDGTINPITLHIYPGKDNVSLPAHQTLHPRTFIEHRLGV